MATQSAAINPVRTTPLSDAAALAACSIARSFVPNDMWPFSNQLLAQLRNSRLKVQTYGHHHALAPPRS
jgi:hypothetical protein